MNTQTEDKPWFNKLVRRKIIWAEIKAKEQEYKRLCNQIEDIEQAKRDISFDVQKKIEESNEISDWLLEQEYEALKKYEK